MKGSTKFMLLLMALALLWLTGCAGGTRGTGVAPTIRTYQDGTVDEDKDKPFWQRKK